MCPLAEADIDSLAKPILIEADGKVVRTGGEVNAPRAVFLGMRPIVVYDQLAGIKGSVLVDVDPEHAAVVAPCPEGDLAFRQRGIATDIDSAAPGDANYVESGKQPAATSIQGVSAEV